MFTIVLILDDGRLREEVADDTPFKPKLLLDEPEPDDEEAEEMVHGECWPPEVLLDGDVGLFFQGWKPLPTAASARGGGDLLDNLLHWAANIASGVPRRLGWSYNESKKNFKML